MTTAFPARLLSDYANLDAALELAFSPDGRTLALGTWSGQVRLLDLSTGKELPGPARHNDWVCSVAFSPDGKFLVSAGGSEFRPVRNGGTTSGQIKLWDRAVAKDFGPLTGHTSKVFSAVFSPDGRTLATGGADWTVRLWDVATAKERAVLKGHRGAVYGLAFTSDGRTLASGSGDETVRLWDVATGTERRTLRGHRSSVTAVAFSPDSRTLASAGMDDAVRVWDLARPE